MIPTPCSKDGPLVTNGATPIKLGFEFSMIPLGLEFPEQLLVVNIFAVWCSKCLSLKPFYEKIASVFQSEEQIFEQQKKYGRIIYYVAWAVEIGAALVGLFLALNLALIAYNKLPGIEQTFFSQARAFGGALPFVIIALIEPTKIYLASGLYHAKPMGWKLLFSFGLLALTFVTFETMYNGLVQQNVNVGRSVQQLQNERSNKLTLLREKGNELERVRARTPESLSRESEAKKASEEASRAEQIRIENQNFRMHHQLFSKTHLPSQKTKGHAFCQYL